MNIKNQLICLSIVAMLMLCVPNVAAASTSKLATVTHNGYATDARSQQVRLATLPTTLDIWITNQNGISINTTTVNHPVFFNGRLWITPLILPLGNAYVDIQVWNGNKWTTWVTSTTGTTGTYIGVFNVQSTPNTTGVFYFRAAYDGGSAYAPCVSNVVQITVVDSLQ